MAPIDLRSDTVTRPTEAMRRAMASADVGDDVYGEDPTVRALESRAAEILGKEAALFVPSGTMANQIALQLHCRPGDEVVAGEGAHLFFYEHGAAAAYAGVQILEAGAGGLFDVDTLSARIKPDLPYLARTRLVCIENTHNRGGGRIFPQRDVIAIAAHARAHGIAVHLDGARIWNAAIAASKSEAELCAPADTVSACFSKGLGAPVGSVLAGSCRAMEEAWRIRRRMGGAMRQSGILCAAALHALEHHRARLAEDHDNAQALARAIASIDGLAIDPTTVDTNIVCFDVTRADAAALVTRAAEAGLLIATIGPTRIRAVTHLDVDRAAIDRAITILARATTGP